MSPARFEGVCDRCRRWRWLQTVRVPGWAQEELCDRCKPRPARPDAQLDLQREMQQRGSSDPATSDWPEGF
jgi:hypothetical protein